MKNVILLTVLFALAACNGVNVKPPTAVEVSCASAAGLFYEVGNKYKNGKYTGQDIIDLKADAAVIDPKCEAAVEPTPESLAADPAVVKAFADLAKKATQ